MTDQLNTQEQLAQKKEHVTIRETNKHTIHATLYVFACLAGLIAYLIIFCLILSYIPV